MVLHSPSKKDKTKEGNGDIVSLHDSEKRSWLQRRTADLIMAEYPDGNFPSGEWSRLYKAAKEQWAEEED